MKKLVVAFVVGFLLFGTSPPVWAQGTFPLEYKLVKDFSYSDQLVSMSMQYVGRSPGMPAEAKGRPADAKGELAYYATGFGVLQLVIVMDSASPPNLFVDRNGDGNFSDEKPVKRTKAADSGDGNQYGPVTVKLGKDGTTARILILRRGDEEMVRICPAGYLTGQVKLGEKSYRIAVIDGDFNGRLEPVKDITGTSRGSGDTLAIDLSGDGSFAYDPYGRGEIQPFTPMVTVADAYYKVKLAADGSDITFDKFEPKMGTLAVKGGNFEVVLLGESGMHYLKGPKTSWDLPEGRYVCQSAGLLLTDEQKSKWVLRTSGKLGDLAAFQIKPGNTKTVELGGPLMVKADVQKQTSGWIFKGTEIAVGFVIVGKGGEEYSPAAEKDGVQVPAPKITIYDQDGKVLAAGNFAYG
jgi:hypothetical protein